MGNLIVSLIIVLILGLSIYKVVIEKRKGSKCVGCVHGGGCSSNKKKPKKLTITKIVNRIKVKEIF